jgi:hypothetical protein
MKTDSFAGMNNVVTKTRNTMSVPSMILNAHVDTDGSVQKREGHELSITLPGAHSLWTNNKGVVLCGAEGVLYRVHDFTSVTSLVDTMEPDAPFSYLEVGGKIYISNKYWTGMFDPVQEAMKRWGASPPDTPIVIPSEGSLPSGYYHIALTTTNEYGRTSGNSHLAEIEIESSEDGVGGIEILNMPENASVWMTDPDGSNLLLLTEGAGLTGNVITGLSLSQEPLTTMWGSSPVPMVHTSWAFGRVWGARGQKVFYSEPYQPELFILDTSFFDMDEEVLMVARGATGMFIGCRDKTVFFAGSSPMEMVQMHAGEGVIPGTLCYATDLGELGRNVPVWLSKTGVCVGTTDGQVINLLRDNVRIDPLQLQGASICRVKDGRRQMMFSMQHKNTGYGQHIGVGDNAVCEIIRNGKVI